MSKEDRDEVLRSARQHVMNAYKDIADLPHGSVSSEEGTLLKEQVRTLLLAMKRRGMAIELPTPSTDRVAALEKEVEQIRADLEQLRDLYEEGTETPSQESEPHA